MNVLIQNVPLLLKQLNCAVVLARDQPFVNCIIGLAALKRSPTTCKEGIDEAGTRLFHRFALEALTSSQRLRPTVLGV